MTKSEVIQDSVKDLADAHWVFILETIERFADFSDSYSHGLLMHEMEWAFKNGFIHGFKHGKREAKK